MIHGYTCDLAEAALLAKQGHTHFKDEPSASEAGAWASEMC